MQISHIILKDFGRFGNFSCDFSPGLNLIKGANEAGKSTLAEAVIAALLMDPASGTDGIARAVRWEGSHGPVIEAVLDVDGSSFKLTKDFEQGVSALLKDNQTVSSGDARNVNSWVSDMLGMPSPEVFKATACVSQGEISHIDDSIEAIKDKLESLVTGNREELAASITVKKIRERMNQIAGGDGVSGGEIGGIKVLVAEAGYNIDKLERDIASLKKKRADLIQMETAYTNVAEDLLSKKEKYELGKKACELEKQDSSLVSELDQLDKRIQRAREAGEKIESLKSQRSQFKKISSSEIGEIEQIDSSLNHLSAKYAELEEDTNEAEEDLRGYKAGGIYSLPTLIGLTASGFFGVSHFQGFLTGFYPHLWYALGGSLALLTLGLSITISRRQHRAFLSTRYNKLAGKLESLKEDIESRKTRLAEKLKQFSETSVEELKKNRWQFEEKEKQIESETVHYNEILDGQTFSGLEKQHGDLTQQLKQSSQEKDRLSQYLTDAADLERQKLVINEFEERVKDLERERAILNQQIETAEGGSELLSSYIERKEEAKNHVETLQRELSVLELTAQCIEEARHNVLVSKLEALNNRTSKILDDLTSGRYSRVRFDKSNLRFEVWSDDKGDWLDPEKWLSAGTLDQIYLAARLALADLVSKEKNSILILDDPFASYDEKRLENAMKVIRELSENHQILLLTSQDHYDKWADSTINL
jgi:DNA repair exonuclease SbcCD ATPase subunit